MRPRLLPSKFRNTRLPSSAVNSLRNTELFHLTSFISHCSALFSATGATQPFWNQFVPHSFYRHGGVRGSIPQPQSIHPPISILQHPQFSTGYLPPAGLLRRKRLAYALLSPGPSEVSMASMTPIPAGAPPERFGLPFWMDRALKELEHVRSSADPDSVHDARVAIRRCRSLASAMQEVDLHPAWRKMRKLPRKLFRALGSLRDAQVLQDRVKQLAWEGDAVRESLLQLLAEREAASRGRVLRSAQRFDEKIWKRLARTLGRRARLVPPGSLAAQCLALERYEEAHELHTRALQIEKPKPWHALRIGLKRFRYTVENLLPDLYASWEDDLKQVQDLLGDLQDFSVLDALLKKASGGILLASAEAMRDRLAAERKQRIANYRQRTLGDAGLWKKWRAGLPSNSHVEAAALARLRAVPPRPPASLCAFLMLWPAPAAPRGSASPRSVTSCAPPSCFTASVQVLVAKPRKRLRATSFFACLSRPAGLANRGRLLRGRCAIIAALNQKESATNSRD